MTNDNNTVLYTGVTSDLIDMVRGHKVKRYPGSFSARYNLGKLVYYENYNGMSEAISREKQIKAGSRRKKIELINRMNPGWEDLYLTLNGG